MADAMEKVPSLDERLLQAFATLTISINKVETFRTTTTELLSYGEKYFQEKIIVVGNQEMAKPEFQELVDAKAFDDLPGLRELICRMVAERSIRISQQVIESAALVFAHTVLDNTLSECCSISSEAAVSDWLRFVEKRTVTLEDLNTATRDDLQRQKVAEFVAQLKRESMNKRFDTLHQVCAPKIKNQRLITAWIEREHLEAFDEVRQNVIHAVGFAQPIPDIADQIMFAALVGTCTLALVGMAHGLNAQGLLDKNPTDKKALFAKVFSGVLSEFPQLEQQIAQWTNAIDHMNKLLTELRNAKDRSGQSPQPESTAGA